jgi:hypothetical protein
LRDLEKFFSRKILAFKFFPFPGTPGAGQSKTEKKNHSYLKKLI